MNPIEQFEIHELFRIVKIGNFEIAFTNSAAYMLAAVALITIFLLGATGKRSLVPSRFQSAAEMSYEFVGKMIQSTAGPEGMRFFPFVFTLFMFILTLNMISLIPHTFSVTSQIIITAALALTVFFTVLTYGFIRHGFHFFNVFVPKGVPLYILPLIVFIELMSFLSRPLSHSVRLFANMLAGHITLQVFAGFIVLLGTGFGAIGWMGGVLPLLMVIMLYALETLVAFLQAYVFAILTCIYLNDAIHPGH
jgi:F-type H+-transporting ATPase subunit a